MQQAAQIGAVITSALGSIGAIAAGNISGAIGFIDSALGGAIPVALAWLSKVIGLGNFGGKVKNIIQKVRGKLDRVTDKIVAKLKGIIEKLKIGAKNTADKAKKFINGIFGRKTFSTKKESHSIWVDVKNNNPTIMIASTPREARVQLRYAHTEAVAKNAKKKAQADRYLSTGMGYVSQALTELRTAAGQTGTGKTNPELYFKQMAAKHASKIAPIAKQLFELAEEGETGQGDTLPPHTVTFECKKSLDYGEYKRQILISQSALRSLSVEQFFKNRSQFRFVVPQEKVERKIKDRSGRDDYHELPAMTQARLSAESELRLFLSNPAGSSRVLSLKAARISGLLATLQTGISAQLGTVKDRAKVAKLSSELANAKRNISIMSGSTALGSEQERMVAARNILSSLAVLHSLDQVASGSPTQLAGSGMDAYGDARVDFSIGASWNKKGRLAGLENHIRSHIGVRHYSSVRLTPVSLTVVQT